MAIVLTGLADFTDKATEIFHKGYLYSPDRANFTIQKGVSYKKKLEYVEMDTTIQGAGCSLTPTGDATFTDKDIETHVCQDVSTYCFSDVRKKGSTIAEIRNAIVTEKIASFKKKMDTMFWNGDTTTTGSTDQYNGVAYLAENNSGVVDIGSTTTLSKVNIDDELQKLVDSYFTNESLMSRTGITIYLPYAIYSMYKQNRLAANFYGDTNKIDDHTMWMYGYENTIKIKAVAGLVGVDNAYLTWEKNIVIPMDEQEEKTYFKLIPDEKTDLLWVKIFTKEGVEFKFNNEFIKLK